MEFINFLHHHLMKTLKILAILLLIANSLTAQEAKDSILVTVDTLSLTGIVVDKDDNPLEGIKVHTTFSPSYTFTNKEGRFHFASVSASDRLYITTKTMTIFENINGSRFIELVFKPLEDYNLNMQSNGFGEHNVSAPRITERQKKKIKSKVYAFDDFGNFFPPSYAGGLEKFYTYMTKNIKFPADAIKHNAEGLVKISFVVKKYGGFKDIKVLRDIGFGCAEEVIRVLKTTEKKWNSASNMAFIDQRVVFQIPFKLID